MKPAALLRITFVLAALFASGLFAAVRAAPAPTWTEVRTTNFVLIGDAGEAEIRQSAARLETFRETIRQIFPQLKLAGGVRTTVVLFKDAESFTAFKPRRADGGIDSAVKGFFLKGDDMNYIALSAAEKNEAYGTIFHEYVHYLLDINIGRTDLPPWLGEGLAEYFETVQVREDRFVTLGIPPPGHLNLLRKNELMPLSDLFTVENSVLHARGDESRSVFYAQAWAAVHYLLHSSGSNKPLRDLLSLAAGYQKNSDAAENFFGTDSTSLARVRTYIAQPVIPSRAFVINAATSAEVQAGPISEADSHAWLGDLLRRLGRNAEAESRLRAALEKDRDHVHANGSLGLLLAGRRDFAKAESHLEKAVSAGKASDLVLLWYAYAIIGRHTDEENTVRSLPVESEAKMRAALLRAVELNPFQTEAYRLLGQISLVTGSSLAEATGHLQKALAARPGDPHLRLLLAQMLSRQERYDEATGLAATLAQNSGDADVWAGANDILRTAAQFRAAAEAQKQDAHAADKVFGPLPPLILKRSTLSDAEVARFDEDRLITNLNIMVPPPRFAEKQAVGYVDKIECSDERITYNVRTQAEKFRLASSGFVPVAMSVLTEGQSTFTLSCGAAFSKQLLLLSYTPALTEAAHTRGRLLRMVFVPDYFRLRTPEELATRRTVIIEEDRPAILRGGASGPIPR